MSKELLPCPFCGGDVEFDAFIGAVTCLGCHVVVYALPRTLPVWNKRVNSPELSELKEAWAVVVEELGLTSEFASASDHATICDALRELNALGAETLSAREDALYHEGRADYFASLLTRLLATRQGRTVGYEPPEVQALWRKVEKAIKYDEKEGAK